MKYGNSLESLLKDFKETLSVVKNPNALTELTEWDSFHFFSIKQITNQEIAERLETKIYWINQYAWRRKLGKSLKKLVNIGTGLTFVASTTGFIVSATSM